MVDNGAVLEHDALRGGQLGDASQPDLEEP